MSGTKFWHRPVPFPHVWNIKFLQHRHRQDYNNLPMEERNAWYDAHICIHIHTVAREKMKIGEKLRFQVEIHGITRPKRDCEMRSFGKILANRIGDRNASGARADARDKDPSFIREIKSPRHYPKVYPRECPRKLMRRVDQSEPIWASRFLSPAACNETRLGPSLVQPANVVTEGNNLGLEARPSSYPSRSTGPSIW